MRESELNRAVRSAIAEWNPQSTSADVQKLYVSDKMTTALQRLKSGGAWLVIGRKGVGKSALIHKFADSLGDDTSFRKQDFDPNLLYSRLAFFGNNFDISSAEKIFKLDILLIAAQQLEYDVRDGDLAKSLRWISNYYVSDLRRLRRKTLNNLSPIFSVLSRVAGISHSANENFSKAGIFRNLDIVDREYEKIRRALADAYRQSLIKKRLYVVFDEIDIKLGDHRNKDAFEQYASVLRSLLSACAAFSDVRDSGIPVYPIVVLRDDIYDNIGIADSGKWRRSAVEVAYSELDIKEIIRYRIAHEMQRAGYQSTVDGWDFDKVWQSYIHKGTPLINQKSMFSGVIERTMYRPRDVVLFLKYLFSRSLDSGYEYIGEHEFRLAKGDYGDYFWEELVDELGYVYPFAPRFESLLSRIFFRDKGNKNEYTPLVSTASVRHEVEKFVRELERDKFVASGEKILKDLVRRSILGMQIQTKAGPRESYFFVDGVSRSINDARAFGLHRGVAEYFQKRKQARKVLSHRRPRRQARVREGGRG